MDFDYSQIFLLVFTITFWVAYFLTFGKVERRWEKSTAAEYGKTRLDFIFNDILGGIAFILWPILIAIYFFNYESVNWFGKISLLDHDFIKIFAMVIMCCFTFPLNALFELSVGKPIEVAVSRSEKPKLATTGIYHYIRHPCYLALDIAVFGTFLIIPNILTLALSLLVITVLYVGTLEEEKTLLKMYGQEYERYRNDVGMFLPKLRVRGKQ